MRVFTWLWRCCKLRQAAGELALKSQDGLSHGLETLQVEKAAQTVNEPQSEQTATSAYKATRLLLRSMRFACNLSHQQQAHMATIYRDAIRRVAGLFDSCASARASVKAY